MWLLLTDLLVLVLEQKVFGLENLSGGEIFREVFFFLLHRLGLPFWEGTRTTSNSQGVYWETPLLGLLVLIEEE